MHVVFIAGLAERLFKQLQSSNERFEVKLMMMNMVSRLVGIHEVSMAFLVCLVIVYCPRLVNVRCSLLTQHLT